MNVKSIRWAFRVTGWQPDESEWCRAVALVQSEEKQRIEKFHYQQDQKASLIGRLMLRGLAIKTKGVANRDLVLGRTDRGRPIVEGGCGEIEYNVSHAGEWVVLAAGPLEHLGVDVMPTVDRRVNRLADFFRLMKRQFTDKEWGVIEGAGTEEQQLMTFFRNWTLKESFVKAIGTGLNIDLQELDFRMSGKLELGKIQTGTKLVRAGVERPEWSFEECLLDNQHVVSVSSTGSSSDPSNVFSELSVRDLFSLFGGETDLLRPMNPADFKRYSSRQNNKPF